MLSLGLNLTKLRLTYTIRLQLFELQLGCIWITTKLQQKKLSHIVWLPFHESKLYKGMH
jgi:hypothetical protein